ncbi:MAG: cyclic nucleotide-binding domain-containing protein [Sulfuritalea sp.]|nr:cyclic nucleotide-binding domain-containing protein [Sulfuritalea sp.]MDP1983764.1 cyclic nucleotide-binding domain-containing protein [Sulfuritalea sp.]
MPAIQLVEVCPGVSWVDIPAANFRLLCGCPADVVKFLIKRGLIHTELRDGVRCESGPNAILLSDVMIQNGTFANLSEFPVLQMLYRQGMLLPKHPNNTGQKPLLIGSAEQLAAQKSYIYRGNYGLVTVGELEAAGVAPTKARRLMRLKRKFAFGQIRDSDAFVDALVVGNVPTEIRNGVIIERQALNVFAIRYRDEAEGIDLNLPVGIDYPAPYQLGYHDTRREYFSVVHSGQGDGWDTNRPSMSSIVMHQGRVYLIDAGPNLKSILIALGIGVSEIDGIFLTHAHDDHFAGIPTLMLANHRIKLFAVPMVRASAIKKLSALLDVEEEEFGHYFDMRDLPLDRWTDVEGLEVRPFFSPHPIETTPFLFRTMSQSGYVTYGHFADIVSLKVFDGMVDAEGTVDAIDRRWFDRVRKDYLQRLDLKKIDVGGGLIHGEAEDFRGDRSRKLILAHSAIEFTAHQREIGSSAPFGVADVLIPATQDYDRRSAQRCLLQLFPAVPAHQLDVLMNSPIEGFNPGTLVLRKGEKPAAIHLILRGTVEAIYQDAGALRLSVGALLGETAVLLRQSMDVTLRAINYVHVLSIPATLYAHFVRRQRIGKQLITIATRRQVLQHTFLFGEKVAHVRLNHLAQSIEEETLPAGLVIDREDSAALDLIVEGLVRRYRGDVLIGEHGPDDYFREISSVFRLPAPDRFEIVVPTRIYKIPGSEIADIPIVRWKLMERRKRMDRQVSERYPLQGNGGTAAPIEPRAE